jgi:hypothetical protein
MADYSSNDIHVYCEVKQTWIMTSPDLPGVTHQITSEITGQMPSERARFYAADMADKVAKLEDWGGGGP